MDAGELLREQPLKLLRHSVVRDQEAIVGGQRYEVAVEQPVRGAGQGDAVLNDVRTAFGYRPDMGSLRFGFAAAVHDAKSGDGAAVVIGVAYLSPEVRFADLAVDEDLLDSSFLLLHRRLG